MSDETLDEARMVMAAWLNNAADCVSVPRMRVALEALIAAERADAERVQRERGCDRPHAVCDDALLDFMAKVQGIEEKATRPYRMALLKLANEVTALQIAEEDVRSAIGYTNWSVLQQRVDEARALITDADIAEARKEDGKCE